MEIEPTSVWAELLRTVSLAEGQKSLVFTEVFTEGNVSEQSNVSCDKYSREFLE